MDNSFLTIKVSDDFEERVKNVREQLEEIDNTSAMLSMRLDNMMKCVSYVSNELKNISRLEKKIKTRTLETLNGKCRLCDSQEQFIKLKEELECGPTQE